MLTFVLWLVALICMAVGVAGTIVPVLPGAPLIFLGIVIAAWSEDFTRFGWRSILVAALFTGLALVTDFVATAYGAKRVGASKLALIGAFLGTIIGMFFFIPGIILGPFIGAAIGEALVRRDLLQAGKVGFGTWLGLVIGTVVKLGIVFTMVGWVILQLFFTSLF